MSNFEITVTDGGFKFQVLVKDGTVQKLKTAGAKSEIDELVKLKSQGYSIRQIAGMTGVSKSKIAKILKNNIQSER